MTVESAPQRSTAKVPLIIAGVVILVIVGFLLSVLFNPKIYSGTKVGELDVSGMTETEAADAIRSFYTPRIQQASVTVYAGDAGREAAQSGTAGSAALAEQDGGSEAATVTSWQVAGTDLGAYIDAEALASQAYQSGREEGGFLSRVYAFFFGTTIEVVASFDQISLETFADKVDNAIGTPRVDYDVEVVSGVASVVPGHDGELANTDVLAREFSNAMLSSGSATSSFTATVEYAPVRIDEDMAQKVADRITTSISGGATFIYGETSWTSLPATIGTWVTTNVEGQDGSWELVPHIARSTFSEDFFENAKVTNTNDQLQVTFSVSDDVVTVGTNGQGDMPQVEQARADLESTLFGTGTGQTTPSITVASGPVPTTLSFDEALEANIITEVSTYSTSFTTYSGTEARNTNIRVGASYLNNSVCKAGGEDWSFNDLVGDTTPDKGYQAAGSISAGEYVDTYGGGICQVATTVFNALFESPYKIVKRYNHSLYISSYPAGRDAAIAWDFLDLTWRNESTSDVLVKMSVDTDSVTCSLYSVPQTYTVTSDVGDWEEGAKYEVEVEYDEDLQTGYSYVKQSGTDGSKITVTRTVRDASGNITYTNTFASTYNAKNKIIVAGPNTKVDTSR